MNTHPTNYSRADASLYTPEKRQTLFAMVIVFAIYGVLLGLVPETTGRRVLDFAASVAFGVLVVSWCAHDRAERRLAAWRGFTFFVIVFPTALVMIPLYLAVTRGLRGITSIALAGLFFCGLCLVAGTTASLVSLMMSA